MSVLWNIPYADLPALLSKIKLVPGVNVNRLSTHVSCTRVSQMSSQLKT